MFSSHYFKRPNCLLFFFVPLGGLLYFYIFFPFSSTLKVWPASSTLSHPKATYSQYKAETTSLYNRHFNKLNRIMPRCAHSTATTMVRTRTSTKSFTYLNVSKRSYHTSSQQRGGCNFSTPMAKIWVPTTSSSLPRQFNFRAYPF